MQSSPSTVSDGTAASYVPICALALEIWALKDLIDCKTELVPAAQSSGSVMAGPGRMVMNGTAPFPHGRYCWAAAALGRSALAVTGAGSGLGDAPILESASSTVASKLLTNEGEA